MQEDHDHYYYAEKRDLVSRERPVIVWSRWPGERWVIERTYPLRYVEDVLKVGPQPVLIGRREVAWFEWGTDANAKERQGTRTDLTAEVRESSRGPTAAEIAAQEANGLATARTN